MMRDRGHYIIHYGNGGAEVDCDEHVSLNSEDRTREFYGYFGKWVKRQYKFDNEDKIYKSFNDNGIVEINKRVQIGDIALSFFGHSPILDSVPSYVLKCEPGIGYASSCYPYRAFESHSVMAYSQGVTKHLGWGNGNSQHPDIMHTVIPNYFDKDDFELYQGPPTERPYWVVLGRVIHCKGGDIAYRGAITLKEDVKYAGQGSKEETLDNPLSDIDVPDNSEYVEFKGHVNIQQRRELLSKAKGLIIMSRYLEPFGGVSVEALMSGIPVIAANRGAFPEIISSKVGHLVNTPSQMIDAMRNISQFDKKTIRDYAISKFSLDIVAKQFEDYFEEIYYYHFFRTALTRTPNLSKYKVSNVHYDKIVVTTDPYIIEDTDETLLIISPNVPRLCDSLVVSETCLGIRETNNRLVQVDYFAEHLENESDITKFIDRYFRGRMPYKHIPHKHLNTRNGTKMATYTCSMNGTLHSIQEELETISVSLKGLNEKVSKFLTQKRVEFENAPQILVDPPTPHLEKVEDPKNKRLKVAVWTSGDCDLSKGLVKHSKHDVTLIDWRYSGDNTSFWVDGGWKNYDVITGSWELTHVPWNKHYGILGPEGPRPLEMVQKMRPYLLNHETNLTSAPNFLAVCNPTTANKCKEVLGDGPRRYIVPLIPGLEVERFTGKLKTEIKKIGVLSDGSKEYARLAGICAMTGTEMVKLEMSHSRNASLYENIDCLYVDTPGFFMPAFEAMLCGRYVIAESSTYCELVLPGMFSTVDEAVKIIGEINNKTDEECDKECADRCEYIDKFAKSFDWKVLIERWDQFWESPENIESPEDTEDIEGMWVDESIEEDKETSGTTHKISDLAVKQVAHLQNIPLKLKDGSMYDPKLNKEDLINLPTIKSM